MFKILSHSFHTATRVAPPADRPMDDEAPKRTWNAPRHWISASPQRNGDAQA